jgi:uncharacterized BrkB/YihY/UPF0761 family membrane protein
MEEILVGLAIGLGLAGARQRAYEATEQGLLPAWKDRHPFIYWTWCLFVVGLGFLAFFIVFGTLLYLLLAYPMDRGDEGDYVNATLSVIAGLIMLTLIVIVWYGYTENKWAQRREQNLPEVQERQRPKQYQCWYYDYDEATQTWTRVTGE